MFSRVRVQCGCAVVVSVSAVTSVGCLRDAVFESCFQCADWERVPVKCCSSVDWEVPMASAGCSVLHGLIG